jgi:SnoaL-like domain
MPSELEEKDSIREIMAEYCFHLDNDRFADMAALFTEDGTWDTAFGKATGRPAIEALVQQIRQSGTSRPRAIHQVTNIVIKLDGARATAFSNWVVVQNSDQGPKIGSAGSYTDDLVKQDRRWLFRYRKINRFIHDKA